MKTFKRETAWALLALWAFLVVAAAMAAFLVPDNAAFERLLSLINAVTVAVIVPVMAAFGADWHSKQSKWKPE
ncbi:MAG: hypothetical protein AAGE89_12575 [Pseudomonadota bacterium]